ncbi:MAG TPA: tRNA (N(6)-L-threonylcarbamoyladenosine(37)-C(2))-methylthiotransferase MtaB [Bacteroidales bacterium]|nr:tRNA (N(6)-L-threonylcarbamoyladenosine(37)-C(2))-methylthiotransferase MtaB [Bacteroidales bacterium]
MSKKRLSYFALGCKLNFAEASAMAAAFKPFDYELVRFGENADLVIINTCSVTETANKKSRKAIQKAIRTSPQAVIVVTGCYAQLKPDDILAIDGVDYIFGAGEKSALAEMADKLEKQTHTCILHSDIRKSPGFLSAWSAGERTRSFLKVQDGCDNFCSYCTIPLARGKSRNLPIKTLTSQAKEIAENGFREIILTGVNIADFGKTTGESFHELLKSLSQIEGIDRFRLSSTEPDLLHNELIDFVLEDPRFMPHFHIPLQSGSDEMLRMMRRKYDTSLFAGRIERIRKADPSAFIGIDLIVGVPGETEERFRESYDFAASLDVSFIHVFTYSERENTLAMKHKPVVPNSIRKDRSRLFHELSEKKSIPFYQRHINQVRPVLFEASMKNGMIHGFTDNYLRVAVPGDYASVNQIRDVRLDSVNENGIFIGKIHKP